MNNIDNIFNYYPLLCGPLRQVCYPFSLKNIGDSLAAIFYWKTLVSCSLDLVTTGMDKLNTAGFDDDEDDWDDDTIQVPAYDPSARADKYCILPAGLTPAERRNFRMEKRLCSNGSSENLSAENGSDGNGSDENGSDENGSVEIELNESQRNWGCNCIYCQV